jgi:hypothetical protein
MKLGEDRDGCDFVLNGRRIPVFDPFILKMALGKALKLIRGLRRQIADIDESTMSKKIIDELDISGWEFTQKPGRSAGFTFETPDDPGD